ncbi:GntR family transcriptional regulator [uncultured Xylophilus sp.]|uniref:GntR family transcriptional regulator n=1 Tax=uncultured Xylophilus sp. TaxID=296832 RepID=UPI0025FE68A8|nr:GntR family transcriptional regulator [uncultured Xylophilus sp.]
MTQPPRLKQLARETLWDRAYAALELALLAGRYAPGERILLRDVADALGISLTPVRDAVNRLVAENILDRGSVGQGGGATVPLLDADQFGQLMTIRSGLEPVAAAAATLHATPEALEPVAAALHEMKDAVETQRLDRYLDAHYRFHFGIYRMSRMPIVEQAIENAWLRCAPTLTLALPRNIPGLKRYPFHEAALGALRRGDADSAAEAIRADIESARADICALLDDAAA